MDYNETTTGDQQVAEAPSGRLSLLWITRPPQVEPKEESLHEMRELHATFRQNFPLKSRRHTPSKCPQNKAAPASPAEHSHPCTPLFLSFSRLNGFNRFTFPHYLPFPYNTMKPLDLFFLCS